MNHTFDSYAQKRIIVGPGEKFSAGCKPGHGWLRVVGSDREVRFYKMPVTNGQLDSSVAAILEEITNENAAGFQSIFVWFRKKSSVLWINEGKFEREQAALSEDFFIFP